jgi:hypothetical protein
MTFWTTTRILNLVGLILLIVCLTYRVGGWRKHWALLKKPVSEAVCTPIDPRYYWWADPMTWLGFGLLVLADWRSWRGV